jgi:site-specific recombinase XerD
MRRAGTLQKTTQVLSEFGSFCPSTADLTPLAVAHWLSTGPPRAPATRQSLLRHLSAACSYGALRGYLADPFDFRAITEWLPDDELEDEDEFPKHRKPEEIKRVLAQADVEAKAGGWVELRTRAAVKVWAYSGAGKTEVLGLRIQDLDLGRRVFKVRSHRRRRLKRRARAAHLPLVRPALEALADWLPHTGCEWVFPHKYRTGPWLSGRPGHRPLDLVKALGERAGVKGLTIVAFRHTVGTLAEEWGIGELMLQRILRHARRRTQWSYRHEDIELLHRAAERIQY